MASRSAVSDAIAIAALCAARDAIRAGRGTPEVMTTLAAAEAALSPEPKKGAGHGPHDAQAA